MKMMKNLEWNKKTVAVSCVVIIAAVSLLVSYYVINFCGAKTFVYTWTKEEQDIINGTLRLEISFEWKGENLSIIAKINDGKAYGFDGIPNFSYLLLVFDRNGNGKIDDVHSPDADSEGAYLFYSKNHFSDTAYLISVEHGGISRCRCVPIKSPYHKCTFEEGVGFTYNISIPRAELEKVKLNDVAVVYEGVSYRYFSTDWVYAYIRGWQ